MILHTFLPAATKLGQGNIFTRVCQEFCPQGGGVSASQCMLGYIPRGRSPPGPDPPGEDPPGKQTAAYGQRAAGTHPTGMHSCFNCVVILKTFIFVTCDDFLLFRNFVITQFIECSYTIFLQKKRAVDKTLE